MPIRNSQREWVFPEIIDVPPDFQASIGGSSVVSQTLFRRGLNNLSAAKGFLDPDQYNPAPPETLPGLEKAVEQILHTLEKAEPILIWGDFDVDGQTSTTLLASALSGLGSPVHHYIPNRAKESHGISPQVLQQKISEFNPSILLTCDTGIDAFDAVELANSAGIKVIITDHHQLPPELPPAYSIINPSMLNTNHALHNLPGVGVAYKLIESLYSKLDKDPSDLLDLVALGIVADVAHQTLDTRYLLQLGLSKLRISSRLGIQELCKITRLDQAEITEEQIGFVIGPRLNALGRLADANSCVEFFTTSDPAKAAELTNMLDRLNSKRQALTETIFEESLKKIDGSPDLVEDYPIIVLQGPSQWDPGVIGIVASRIVERFHKPVIMLSQDGNLARGSARSVSGVPISDLIAESASLLKSYGGHPMAAGVSLDLDNVSRFRYDLKENFTRIVGASPAPPTIVIDADIPFNSISANFIMDFQRLAPFGAGNPKLLFSTRSVNLDPGDIKTIGKNSNHKKITLTDSSGTSQDLLWWNSKDLDLPSSLFDVAYSLELSKFRNQLQVQATLRHFREISGPAVIMKGKKKIELEDFRSIDSPVEKLPELLRSNKAVIWSELLSITGFDVFRRLELSNADTLIVWSTPPSRNVFKFAIDQTNPQKIVFFAIDPEVQTLQNFVIKLHGLLKYFLETNNSVYDPDQFSQGIAVTPALIQVGLEWIHAHGDYDLTNFKSEGLILPGPRTNLDIFPEIDQKLKYMLREMAAYRAYFSKASLDTLL